MGLLIIKTILEETLDVSEETVATGVNFPPIDERVNLLLILGGVIFVLIVLLSLKIYHRENQSEGD